MKLPTFFFFFYSNTILTNQVGAYLGIMASIDCSQSNYTAHRGWWSIPVVTPHQEVTRVASYFHVFTHAWAHELTFGNPLPKKGTPTSLDSFCLFPFHVCMPNRWKWWCVCCVAWVGDMAVWQSYFPCLHLYAEYMEMVMFVWCEGVESMGVCQSLFYSLHLYAKFMEMSVRLCCDVE